MLDFLKAYPTPNKWNQCRLDLQKAGWSPTQFRHLMTHPDFPNHKREDNAWDISAAYFFTTFPERYETLPKSITNLGRKRSLKSVGVN